MTYINLFDVVKVDPRNRLLWYDYFRREKIILVNNFKDKNSIMFIGEALGTSVYNLKIKFEYKNKIEASYHCSCPAFEKYGMCKHIAWFLVEIMFYHGIYISEDGHIASDYVEFFKLLLLKNEYNDLFVDEFLDRDSFVRYIHWLTPSYEEQKIWKLYDIVYGYTKTDMFSLLTNSFLKQKREETFLKDNEVYKVKVFQNSAWGIWLSLYKAKKQKNGKISAWKKLTIEDEFDDKFSYLRPFMDSNKNWNAPVLDISNAPDLFAELSEKYIDYLYVSGKKINKVYYPSYLKLKLKRISDIILVKPIIVFNWLEKEIDFANFYLSEQNWIFVDDDVMYIFSTNLPFEIIQYIWNQWWLLEIESNKIEQFKKSFPNKEAIETIHNYELLWITEKKNRTRMNSKNTDRWSRRNNNS